MYRSQRRWHWLSIRLCHHSAIKFSCMRLQRFLAASCSALICYQSGRLVAACRIPLAAARRSSVPNWARPFLRRPPALRFRPPPHRSQKTRRSCLDCRRPHSPRTPSCVPAVPTLALSAAAPRVRYPGIRRSHRDEMLARTRWACLVAAAADACQKLH